MRGAHLGWWMESMTVFPSLARSDRIPTTECAVCESSPDVGSSRTATNTSTTRVCLIRHGITHRLDGFGQYQRTKKTAPLTHCLHVVWLLQGPEVLGG